MRTEQEITVHMLDLMDRIYNLNRELTFTTNKRSKKSILAVKEGIHFIQANVNTLKWVLDDITRESSSRTSW